MDVNVNSSPFARIIDSRQVATELTDKNHLDKLLLREPFQFGVLVSYLVGKDKQLPMQCLTEAMGRVEEREVDADMYQWEVQYQNNKAVRITEGASGTNLGIDNTPVQITVEDRWFKGGGKVRMQSGRIARIVSEPVQVAKGWLLTLQFADPNDFFDPIDLIVGSTLVRAWFSVGELSTTGDMIEFYTGAKFQNYLTTHRIEQKVSAEAMKQKIAIQMLTKDGNTATTWIEKLKWEAMTQLMKMEDLQLLYGKMETGQQLSLDAGRPITEGAGLRQQISARNKQTYNSFSLALLEDYLMELSWIANKTTGGDFKFVALTGREGMRVFNNAVQAEARNLNIKVYGDGQFISGTGMNMKFGSQFKTVEFPNGLEFSVIHCPWYDDLNWNRLLDPKTGKPLESSRFTIFNIGNNSQGAQLKKITLKGAKMGFASIPGMIDINGNYIQNFGNTSSTLDGTMLAGIRRSGILLTDPLSAGKLIPSRLAERAGLV